MGRVGALQARFARRRNGAQIAADIGRRQSEAAQARDHHMGEILADAVTFFEHFVERRRDHGGLRVVFEFGPDPVHQIDRAGQNPARGREALRRILGDRRQHRHQRAGKNITDRRRRAEAGGLKGHVADAFPGRLCAARPGALRDTDTRERESIRRLRCGVSISTLSVWVPKKSRRTVRSAGRGRISTVCETNCWPPPLFGSSRSEHRAKLTGLS